MTVKEIFEMPAIATLEKTILDIHYEMERRRYHYCGQETETIKNLLESRQYELSKMFVMDEEYKQLLNDFNEALKAELLKMRLRTIKAYESAIESNSDEQIEVEGVCNLGYNYSTLHPVQTTRAKKIWALLNGTIDDKFNPMYALCHDGVAFNIYNPHDEIDSANQLLYLSEKEDNWNIEGLDKEMTNDMHLIYPIHSLLMHTNFSIFDFLWVRDFNIEITVHIESETHHIPQNEEELDWSEMDYN